MIYIISTDYDDYEGSLIEAAFTDPNDVALWWKNDWRSGGYSYRAREIFVRTTATNGIVPDGTDHVFGILDFIEENKS